MSLTEKRTLDHWIKRQRYNLWWWELDGSGIHGILQEDLVLYEKFDGWLKDRARMKRDMEEQTARAKTGR
jgi:hypothetical protein